MIRANRSPYGWLVVIPVLAGLFAYGSISSTENLARAHEGTPALAQILKSAEGDCMAAVRASHCTSLRLQVHPPSQPVFAVTIDVRIAEHDMPRFEAKQWVKVVIDRKDPRRVRLDVDGLAEAPPPAPSGALVR